MKSATKRDSDFLSIAIEISRKSVETGGFPVGALIVQNDEIISSGNSNGKVLHDPTSHAETEAIRATCLKLERRALKDCVLYTSMEPCLMCLAACTWASIPKVVYAIGRPSLDPIHSEGDHDTALINQAMRKPVELVHIEKLEPLGLEVIHNWEIKTD